MEVTNEKILRGKAREIKKCIEEYNLEKDINEEINKKLEILELKKEIDDLMVAVYQSRNIRGNKDKDDDKEFKAIKREIGYSDICYKVKQIRQS